MPATKCDAQLVIPTADNTNEVVCRCQLEKDHTGPHKFSSAKGAGEYSITWWPTELNRISAADMTVFSYEA